jgi:hypothetical protein
MNRALRVFRRAEAMLAFAGLCFVTGVASRALAQDPRIRATLDARGDIWVGQRVTLVVELLAPGFFTGAPAFDLPDPAGMLLVPPAGSPVIGTEEIDGTSYTVQRHELSIFSRRMGEQTIPPITVRFHFKRQPLDKEGIATTLQTPAIHLTTKTPPGAEKLGGIISARDLTIVETWEPDPGKAPKVGDAFTRLITFRAPDVPAMAFPPFPVPKIDGLGIYPKTPEVLDASDRGSLTGKRRDTIVYVCQRPGRFTIPEVKMTWFDLDAQKLRVVRFPARTIDVSPNPAMAAAPAGLAAPVHYSGRFWAILALVILTLGVLVIPESIWRRWLAPLRPVHLSPLNPGDGIPHPPPQGGKAFGPASNRGQNRPSSRA